MPRRRVLILGGTHEARHLAQMLGEAGFETITSLAGVTENPQLPPGAQRRGGFGGAKGLADYISRENIVAIADATHPFATKISENAALAAKETGIPCLRLERPAWKPEPGDRWTSVASVGEAAAAMPARARPLVTVGRKEIEAFLARADVVGFCRMIEPPVEAVPGNWTLLRQRGPFTVTGEQKLIRHHAITILVTKNAGGEDTAAKLVAARKAGLPVIMVERPRSGILPDCATALELALLLRKLLSP